MDGPRAPVRPGRHPKSNTAPAGLTSRTGNLAEMVNARRPITVMALGVAAGLQLLNVQTHRIMPVLWGEGGAQFYGVDNRGDAHRLQNVWPDR